MRADIASRISTAVCTARAAGSSQGIGSLNHTMSPSPASTDCAGELLQVAHPLLEQVRATLGAALEQRVGVTGFGGLTQHDDAQLGVRGAKLLGGADPLVEVRRRHSDAASSSGSRLLQAATTSRSGSAPSNRRSP
jgi:hypothetical protein